MSNTICLQVHLEVAINVTKLSAIMKHVELVYCGHCNKRLSRKAYMEHHRLYYHEGEWIHEDSLTIASSPPSSPFS